MTRNVLTLLTIMPLTLILIALTGCSLSPEQHAQQHGCEHAEAGDEGDELTAAADRASDDSAEMTLGHVPAIVTLTPGQENWVRLTVNDERMTLLQGSHTDAILGLFHEDETENELPEPGDNPYCEEIVATWMFTAHAGDWHLQLDPEVTTELRLHAVIVDDEEHDEHDEHE